LRHLIAMFTRLSRLVLLGLWMSTGVMLARAADAPEAAPESVSIHGQVTYNWQKHLAFSDSRGAGSNSLMSSAEKMYTFTGTAFLGMRPWANGELYFNPEVAQGVPFTGNLVGLGGFTNGEITRAAGSTPSVYRQRLFVRQTWNRGGGTEMLEAGANQLAGSVDRNRVVLTAGNFSTLDVFDNNAYAKDPRTQFMNWGSWTYAAYDYAADSRGFGWGAALEWYQDAWAFRVGRMTGPKEPNGLPVDFALGKHYGDQLEVEREHVLGGQPGKVRMLWWHNRAVLARYDDATQWQLANPGVYADPRALVSSRTGEQDKHGLGLNIEQAFSPAVGFFLRWMKADGKTETHAFTEADGSLATGLLLNGSLWGRSDDSVGVAFMQNTLSAQRRRFLASGGTSFFIGDGYLDYKPETIVETFYSRSVARDAWVTLDYQHVANPAYNAARGPVNVVAVRFHVDF
jgi:high affinity Mn2+ porin